MSDSFRISTDRCRRCDRLLASTYPLPADWPCDECQLRWALKECFMLMWELPADVRDTAFLDALEKRFPFLGDGNE